MTSTVELNMSGLIATTKHSDMQKIRIIGFFFKNSLHWQFLVGKNVYKLLFWATYLFTYRQNINTQFLICI